MLASSSQQLIITQCFVDSSLMLERTHMHIQMTQCERASSLDIFSTVRTQLTNQGPQQAKQVADQSSLPRHHHHRSLTPFTF